mgnify:CR=1 FL=1
MLIQTERIWLFETSIIDPYFIGTKDGITSSVLVDNPRIIQNLDINEVYFYLDEIARGGLKYTQSFGGEDTDISNTYGKSMASYSLEMLVPTFNQLTIEEMVGKEFSILAMRRDLSHFVIFGRFVAAPLTIDNDVQQRITFKSSASNAKIFDVQSFNITTIVNTLNCETLSGAGFDYNFDFALD